MGFIMPIHWLHVSINTENHKRLHNTCFNNVSILYKNIHKFRMIYTHEGLKDAWNLQWFMQKPGWIMLWSNHRWRLYGACRQTVIQCILVPRRMAQRDGWAHSRSGPRNTQSQNLLAGKEGDHNPEASPFPFKNHSTQRKHPLVPVDRVLNELPDSSCFAPEPQKAPAFHTNQLRGLVRLFCCPCTTKFHHN